ncbi:MAG: MFS transporter [Candidatus Parvarchaeota archaeon]|nr:MFS transporter [Candidatus Jingweiarchaeum tengchongense]MCW1298674.1 MFS transporter [Candidatus Jingweiarchaeum tengchongense]MCW1300516.1 MFS transporter [Candidatus Jingweiarchaeum tengchongense]MCW1304669.1 MFS transporter [Candidatus Jingweiarchaeum tengchongense]MCW1305858.1 MFS transporter [Candidatus Jingweiarchaeum tengchongense]
MAIYESLEKSEIRAFHYKFLGIGCLAWAFNAIAVMIISYALPSILKDWNLSMEASSLIAMSHYVGMFIGASFCGMIADRIGRKPTTMLAVFLYSIFTGLCAFAWNSISLMIFRFLAGLGTGGIMPVLSAWMSEYIPTHRRGRFVAILESSWSFGALFISIFSWLMIPLYGWRSIFFIAFLSVFFIFLIKNYIPESIRFLEEKGRTKEALCTLKKYGFKVFRGKHKETRKKVSVKELFSEQFLKRTIMLWVLWFCIAYTYHGIFVWLPTILFKQGFTIVKALWYTTLITAVQVPGYLSAAYLIEKIGRKPILVSYMIIAGIASYFFGTSSTELSILVFGSAISFFNLGAWAVTYAYTPELYPTRIRGTGTGYAGAMARIAGILTPSFTAFLVSSFGTFQTFLVFFIAHFIAAAFVLVLGIETKGRTLEEISA